MDKHVLVENYDPHTKRQSIKWKHSDLKANQPVMRAMPVYFWDMKWSIAIDLHENVEIVNSASLPTI